MQKEDVKIDDLGIVLTDKGARLICARKKKEIVLDSVSSKHIGKPIFLCGNKVYGIVILNEPQKLDLDQFKSHSKRHLINDQLKNKLWSGIETFYTYSFRIKRIFREPIDCRVKNQLGFVDKLEIEMEKRKEFTKGVIGFKDLGKAPIETSWDGSEERRKATVEDLRIMSVWFDSEKSDVKSSYKLPHHKAEGKHVAVWNGIRAAMAALLGARGGVYIPENDKKGVYNHLVKHYNQFEKEVPTFKNYSDEDLEKLFPEFFKNDELFKDQDFDKYYEDLEILEKQIIAKKGYEDITAILIKLYKALIKRMELKYTKKYDEFYDAEGFTKAISIIVEGNFIRARLRSPGSIVQDSFRTITLSKDKGITAIIGKLKSDLTGPTHIQSVLFEKAKWSIASARVWIQENRDSLKSMRYIKCEHCNTYFNYSGQKEVTMGLVNCPNCENTVNQKGK